MLRRIAFIVFAQRVGLTLEEIGAELAKLPPERAPDAPRLGAPVEQLDARASISASPSCSGCKAGLTECIGCGCLSLDRCKLANPDDRAERLGPGPRYWIGDRPLSP